MTHIEGSSMGPLITHYVLNPAKKSSSHALIYRREKNIVTSMKRLVTLLTLVLVALSLSAAVTYSVGVEGGADYNTIIAGKGYRDYTYSGKISYTVSVPVVVEFTPSLGLQTGVTFAEKDYHYGRTLSYTDTSGETSSIRTIDYILYNGFLELPVAFRYTLNFGEDSDWAVYATAGGYLGYWLKGRRTGSILGSSLVGATENIDEAVNFDYYNRFEAGVNASLGVKWQFSEKFDAHVQIGYSLSLTDMNKYQKHGSYPIHNSTVTVSGGLMWGINK